MAHSAELMRTKRSSVSTKARPTGAPSPTTSKSALASLADTAHRNLTTSTQPHAHDPPQPGHGTLTVADRRHVQPAPVVAAADGHPDREVEPLGDHRARSIAVAPHDPAAVGAERL